MVMGRRLKIVFLKGGATTGKSTAFKNLKKKKGMEEWVFLDHPELKSWFERIKDFKEIRKEALFATMKPIMKSRKNIILEEMSGKTTKKYLKSFIKKYNYELLTFEFVLEDFDLAMERDITRVKNKTRHHRRTLSRKIILDNHKHHKENLDENSIFINTKKLSPNQVINTIIKKLK
jgi:hypothetical protein